MDQKNSGNLRERSRRPIRNKKYNRRNFGEDKKPQKRLFTPEIKRFLKDWLVRRRDNPYPNRGEKQTLAIQTGLTYIQVCNWFANWRRKLKNAGKEPQRKTWGHLIKSYNSQVRGNVEHFSICSDDSIWQEPDQSQEDLQEQQSNFDGNGNYESDIHFENTDCYKNGSIGRCSAVSDKNQNLPGPPRQEQGKIVNNSDCAESNPFSQYSNKYKNHIMEKYLRDCQKPENYLKTIENEEKISEEDANKPSMISKWIESAENFKPSEYSYLQWTFPKSQKKKSKRIENEEKFLIQQHGKEELDAAEALTKLALAHSFSKLQN